MSFYFETRVLVLKVKLYFLPPAEGSIGSNFKRVDFGFCAVFALQTCDFRILFFTDCTYPLCQFPVGLGLELTVCESC